MKQKLITEIRSILDFMRIYSEAHTMEQAEQLGEDMKRIVASLC